MKTLLTLVVFAFAAVSFAADAPAPRILVLTGAPHPKAEVQKVDAANGVLVFRWLDSNSKPVDSGGSIARFAPVEPVPPVPPATVATYPEPTDAALIAAIENPPADPAPPPHRVLKDTIIQRVKAAGMLAGLAAIVAGLPADQKFEWDNSSWFRSDNPQLLAVAPALGLDPKVVLAKDPLAP